MGKIYLLVREISAGMSWNHQHVGWCHGVPLHDAVLGKVPRRVCLGRTGIGLYLCILMQSTEYRISPSKAMSV